MKPFFTSAALVFSACCTEVGFSSALSFELPQDAADALVAAPTELRTCLNAACWDTHFDATDAGESWLLGPIFNGSTRTLELQQQGISRREG